MKYITLSCATATMMMATANTSVYAESDHKIVDEPLELSIQMNHARYPRYLEEWPVEQAARKATNIHLKDVTIGANVRTDENSGKT